MGPSEIARRLGIGRSSVCRLLAVVANGETTSQHLELKREQVVLSKIPNNQGYCIKQSNSSHSRI